MLLSCFAGLPHLNDGDDADVTGGGGGGVKYATDKRPDADAAIFGCSITW